MQRLVEQVVITPHPSNKGSGKSREYNDPHGQRGETLLERGLTHDLLQAETLLQIFLDIVSCKCT